MTPPRRADDTKLQDLIDRFDTFDEKFDDFEKETRAARLGTNEVVGNLSTKVTLMETTYGPMLQEMLGHRTWWQQTKSEAMRKGFINALSLVLLIMFLGLLFGVPKYLAKFYQ